MDGDKQGQGLKQLFFGDAALGLWLIPLFLLVGVLGAVLAVVFSSVYYSNQQGGDASEAAQSSDGGTGGATGVAEPVEFPYDKTRQAGVYRIRAQPTGQPSRVGSGFVVYSGRDAAYFVTTHSLVDRRASDRSVGKVEVKLPGGWVDARVHNYSERRDLAIVVLEKRVRELPVPEWRASLEGLQAGDTLYLVGVAGSVGEPIVQGTVADVSSHGIVGSMPVDESMAGGAFMDARGQVLGVASKAYEPAGMSPGADQGVGVPIGMLCERLLECTAGDDPGGAAGAGPSGGGQSQGNAAGQSQGTVEQQSQGTAGEDQRSQGAAEPQP